mmetsp:Transcript_3439/g.12090  ORF Transcript_3439/g.12090 Transcript_3439/m.12090 type:complete len:282 (-) Transcript_3439:1778-2623(-)
MGVVIDILHLAVRLSFSWRAIRSLLIFSRRCFVSARFFSFSLFAALAAGRLDVIESTFFDQCSVISLSFSVVDDEPLADCFATAASILCFLCSLRRASFWCVCSRSVLPAVDLTAGTLTVCTAVEETPVLVSCFGADSSTGDAMGATVATYEAVAARRVEPPFSAKHWSSSSSCFCLRALSSWRCLCSAWTRALAASMDSRLFLAASRSFFFCLSFFSSSFCFVILVTKLSTIFSITASRCSRTAAFSFSLCFAAITSTALAMTLSTRFLSSSLSFSSSAS